VLREAETTREADLSTEQARAQAPSRLPQPHGNQGGPQGNCATPFARPQAAECVSPAPRGISVRRLTKRADYVAAAAGITQAAGALVLQARSRDDAKPARFGFTVSKKVGNAPQRNRVRRRLKELVRLAQPGDARAGHDYVLVGRRVALKRPFEELTGEFRGVLRRINAAMARRSSSGGVKADGPARQLASETLR
jgi:ribonuclease P protein component